MLSRSNHYLGRVHRRIGGLEIPLGQIDVKASVHRRIGGLENEKHDQRMVNMVHRRIGGLETREWLSE